ncbi:MAG: hypothetical protein ACI4D4_07595 [Lachnospira sp.]
MISSEKKSLNKLFNKRKNSKNIVGKGTSNYSLLKNENGQEMYAVSQSCEIIDNELYFNACLRVNLSTKKGKNIIESIKKTGRNPIHKLIKEVEFEQKELDEIIKIVEEQNNNKIIEDK